MILFFKSFIIGIAKIIPGVSGAMLAVNFSIYDKLINSITNFFNDKKNNLKFLLIFGSGVLLAITLFSRIIRYFIDNYYLITMMLFIGLITGGTYNFSKNIKLNIKNTIIIIVIVIFLLLISLSNINNNYIIRNNYLDYIVLFIGGVIEIFSSIVPGISGTSLLMLIGIYDNILILLSNTLNLPFVIDNITLYLSYGIGMFISFIIFSIIISYLLKKYRNLFDTIILGLSLSSIIILVIMTFSKSFTFVDLIIGIILFSTGLLISCLFDK